jgi:predicted Ser/Thr protein kinase
MKWAATFSSAPEFFKGKKPDALLLRQGDDTAIKSLQPLQIMVVLEIKKCKQVFTFTEVGQTIEYAKELLGSSPVAVRSRVITAITDLHKIQLFDISYSGTTVPLFKYRKTAILENAKDILLRLLCTDVSYFISSLTAGGTIVVPQTCLGQGVSSQVFYTFFREAPAAVKMYLGDKYRELEQECQTLQAISGIPGVPEFLTKCDKQCAFLMRPVGEPVSQLSLPEVKQLFPPLVSTLQQVHEKGLVHRDIRPANLVLVKNPDHLVLIDWGFSAPADTPLYYQGTTKTASDRVLKLLAEEQPFAVGRSDDLISLVRTAALLQSHTKGMPESKNDYTGILEYWRPVSKSFLAPLFQAASNADYKTLSSLFFSLC